LLVTCQNKTLKGKIRNGVKASAFYFNASESLFFFSSLLNNLAGLFTHWGIRETLGEVGAVRDRRKRTYERKRVDKKTPTSLSV